MPRELDEHRQYLQDRHRVDAFAAAIQAAVHPGDVVVDLGCGTGILGLFACRAGARRVYAIDEGGMAEVARALAAENGLGDRITIVSGHSLDVSLPEPADVLVSDQIGQFGFDAGVLEYSADARRRFLKPDARIVPRSISLWVAPVEAPAFRGDVAFWSSRPCGFGMTSAQATAWNSGHSRRLEPGQLLASGSCAATLDVGEPHDVVRFSTDIIVSRAGTLDAIAGWFSAELAEGASMSNAPGDPQRINRRNLLFAIERPTPVRPGNLVRVEMRIRHADDLVRWVVEVWPSVEHARGGDSRCRSERFDRSTFEGMPLAVADLRRTAPAFRPRVSERGRARALVLKMMDGRSSVADIEQAVANEYGHLLTTPAAASRFVAEVVTRYAE